MKKAVILGLVVILGISLFADPYEYSSESQNFEPVVELINNDILDWINSSIIIEAIIEANKNNQSRTEDEIIAQDNKWRAGDESFQNSYLNTDVSDFLREKQSDSNGVYAEIFVMDFQGCNVAQSDLTSDFWQGDEAKFKLSYNNGMGSIFIDEIEFDESSEAYVVQVSLPIVNSNNEVIGAITFGIDMSTL